MSDHAQETIDRRITPENRAAYATQARYGGAMFFVGSIIPDTRPPQPAARPTRTKTFRKILHFFVDHL